MTEAHFSPKAVEDLDDILEYIARDKPEAAVRFVASLKEKCLALARFPGIGAPRDDLIEGLRAFSVGNYMIYYTQHQERVRVERVIHGARERDALLGEIDAHESTTD